MDSYFVDYPMRYEIFEKDFLRRSAVERKVEIMGEAINRILKRDPSFDLPNAKEIINTRIELYIVMIMLHLNFCGD